ncbi:MAG: hypothetical protein N2691_01415 [Patescibacteria group bacterium]|nr:hypothetical protein [Patescibacteria group bacterium]
MSVSEFEAGYGRSPQPADLGRDMNGRHNGHEPLLPLREEITDLLMGALEHPTEMAKWLTRQDIPHLPVGYDPGRGNIHFLSQLDMSTVGKASALVIANSGAFGYNERYWALQDIEREARKQVMMDEEADGPLMLGFTRPGDLLVIGSSNPEQTRLVLERICESFEGIGVTLTGKYKIVSSVAEYMAQNSAPDLVIPHVMDPRLLYWYGRSHGDPYAYFLAGLRNSVAYQKTHFEWLMRNGGIPVPRTVYTRHDPNQVDAYARELLCQFQAYDRLVISSAGGIGGSDVHFVPRDPDEIRKTLHQHFRTGMEVFTQGAMELSGSPCVRINITEDKISVIGIAQQRFLGNGQHAGNESYDGLMEYYNQLYPGFIDYVERAANVLRAAGVRGQINIDILLATAEEIQLRGEKSRINFREGNVRPAYSATESALRRGTIDGQPISRVHMNSKVPLTFEQFARDDFMAVLNPMDSRQSRMRVVFVNYDAHDPDHSRRYAYLCFVGIEGVSEEELNAYEREVIATLRS